MHAPLPANGIQFVNEYYARRMAFCLLEQIAHTRGAHTDKHFNEITSADRKERHVGFTGNGASK